MFHILTYVKQPPSGIRAREWQRFCSLIESPIRRSFVFIIRHSKITGTLSSLNSRGNSPERRKTALDGYVNTVVATSRSDVCQKKGSVALVNSGLIVTTTKCVPMSPLTELKSLLWILKFAASLTLKVLHACPRYQAVGLARRLSTLA
jgi:hypothetical protein